MKKAFIIFVKEWNGIYVRNAAGYTADSYVALFMANSHIEKQGVSKESLKTYTRVE